MECSQALVWITLLLQATVVASENLRVHGRPNYMDQAGNAEGVADKRHDLGIAKGELLAEIYTECTVRYNESKIIAKTVQVKAGLKAKESKENEEALEAKIGAATAGDNEKDPQTGMSQKMEWMDQRDNEKAEAVFYKQIIGNAEQVEEMAEKGFVDTATLRKNVDKEFDDLDNWKTPYESQVDDASETLAEAKRLWKQWEDSSKDYDCGVPVSVKHAESQCDAGNTKFGIKCLIKCVPGYDDPIDSKNLYRCRKEGKFGRQLYGEWKGYATCVGRMCGVPATIDKSKTVNQKIRFPHAATYNCYEGYSQDGDAKGAKAFDIPCGTTGAFEQTSEHVCQPVKCGSAPVVSGSEDVPGKFVFPQVVNYKCKLGHTLDETPGGLKGFPVSCEATGEFSSGHECKRVRCGPAPDYDATTATRVTAQGEKYYGDDIDFKCADGYSLDQKPGGAKAFTLTCDHEGAFSEKGDGNIGVPPPQCRPVSAGMLPDMPHGNAKSREMFFGDSIVVTADTGYSTAAKPTSGLQFTVSVTTEGTFAGIETFKPVSCGAPPSVEKAKTSFADKEGVYTDILDYFCEDGYSTNEKDSQATKIFSLSCEADADYTRVPDFGLCANINDCEDHSCGPHGDCVDHLKNYTCSCESGFEQTWSDETAELVCGNINDCGAEACGAGTCEDLVNDYKCHCPTGYEEVGEAEEKTCKKKVCGLPPVVSHATTTPLEVADEKADYQSNIVYQCDTGYTLDGSATGSNHFDIDCKASTSFTDTKSCEPIKCGNSPEIEHASKSPAAATFNESVRYTCEDGYTIDATPTGDASFSLTCLVTGTYSEQFKCKPVNCGEPDELAMSSRPDGSLVFKEEVKYYCFSGYTLDGKKGGKTDFTVKCNEDGSLDKLKECLPKVCGVPHKHINAKHATTADEGAVAYPRQTEVTCRDGYTTDGSAAGDKSFTVECLESGEFDEYDKSTCEPVRCGAPPEMANATLDHVSSPHTPADKDNLNFEEKAFYKCLPGFTTGGEPNAPKMFKVECLPNGQISAPAEDMQCRNVDDCELHTCGPEGTCIDLIGPSPAYTCDCVHGFEIQTKSNGEKTCGNTDDCKDQDCGVGICKDLIGDYTCACPAGYFIGLKNARKTCVAVTCKDETPSLEHGKQTTDHSGPIVFPTTLQYKCDEGYSIDGSVADSKRRFQAQCKPNADLAGMMSCQKISCGSPDTLPFTNIESHSDTTVSIEYKEEVKYKCFDGYTLGGKPDDGTEFSTSCPDNGILTDPQVCEPVYCGKAPSVSHSKSGVSGDVFFGMQLSYTCDTGYTRDGTALGDTSFHRRCQRDGKFSDLDSDAPCKPVYGGKAPVVQNADMTEYGGSGVTSFPPDIYYPHGLEYKCKAGYSENGSPSGRLKITSRVNTLGQLTPPLPTECFPITFSITGLLKDARNGQSLAGAEVVSSTGSTVTCHNGYFTFSGIRSGSITLTYKRSGFIETTKTFVVGGDIRAGGAADTSMSPSMGPGEWRAVVKWNEKPYDLDTYGKWGTTKAYWQNTVASNVGMKLTLEHDDTDGHGPETLHFRGVGHCTASANGGYPLKTERDNKCLDYNYGNGNVYMHRCHGGSNQNWYFDGDTVRIRSEGLHLKTKRDNKCLDYNYNNGNVYMHDCHGGDNQKWRLDGQSLKTKHDDKCLDYNYGNGNVYMHNCHGGSNQRWNLEGPVGGSYCDIRYMINDYNEGGKMKDISDAQVTLYHGDGVAGTWKINEGNCKNTVSRDGNWWHVFTVDGKTDQLKWACDQGPEIRTTPGGGDFNSMGFLLHNDTKKATGIGSTWSINDMIGSEGKNTGRKASKPWGILRPHADTQKLATDAANKTLEPWASVQVQEQVVPDKTVRPHVQAPKSRIGHYPASVLKAQVPLLAKTRL